MQRRVKEVNVTIRERQMSIRLPVTSKETEEKRKKYKEQMRLNSPARNIYKNLA